jgi:hypothetical protein
MRCNIVGTATSMSALWSAIIFSVFSALNRPGDHLVAQRGAGQVGGPAGAVEDRRDDDHCSLARERNPISECAEANGDTVSRGRPWAGRWCRWSG